MLKKEVLPASVWDPCRRHEDRSPPIVGLAPMVAFVLIVTTILGHFVYQLREDDQQVEQVWRRALEMEIRANIRALDDLERGHDLQTGPVDPLVGGVSFRMY